MKDLQWIVFIVLIFALAASTFFLFYLTPSKIKNVSFAEVAGAYAAAFAGINWAYQAGSRRMGTVDMFAAEISVICRVLIVVNFAKGSSEEAGRRIERVIEHDTGSLKLVGSGGLHGLGSASKAGPKFTSQEDYTPAYDDHASELAPLDADVVTLTTEFYTYRKTMLDLMRAAAEETEDLRSCHLWREMIYMQFLMYESARNAVCWLIEYEPTRSESLVNILCSELVVYAFLVEHYEADDYRTARLLLRKETYADQVPKLLLKIRANSDNDDWLRARTTADELEKRFNLICERVDIEKLQPLTTVAQLA